MSPPSLARFAALAISLFAVTALPAVAAPITDPANDFLASYVGPQNADLDVLAAQGDFLGSRFVFGATLNGAVGTTSGGVYVFGVNRGQGTARFGALATGVLFDSVVVVAPGSTSFVRDFVSNAVTNLAASDVAVSGSNVQVSVDASLLPTRGFALEAYTFNLWPRSGLTNNNQIADFAPNNSNASVGVSEPASLSLLGLGMLGVAALRRRTVGTC